MPTLSLVVCGAPLATRTDDLVAQAADERWEVVVTATAAAGLWYRSSDTVADRGPRHPDALLVCPLTFNTANKWAMGISDNAALGLLNEALGSSIPVVAVPMVNDTLWRHPAWPATLAQLTRAEVTLVDPTSGTTPGAPVRSGTGEQVAAAFDPAWVLRRLTRSD